MGRGRTDDFREDAVGIALTSGLTCKQVAADPCIGMSTLNKWITAHRDTDAERMAHGLSGAAMALNSDSPVFVPLRKLI